jgi:hypothetical protein
MREGIRTGGKEGRLGETGNGGVQPMEEVGKRGGCVCVAFPNSTNPHPAQS